MIPLPMSANQVLDQYFLEARCKLLEVAATFDRLDRAAGSNADDPRRRKLRQALDVLANDQSNRAEQLQMLFSRAYDAKWIEQLDRWRAETAP